MVRPGNPRIQGPDIGAAGVAADDRLDVVVAVPRGETADDGQAVGPLSQLWERTAEGDARNLRGHFARGAARAGRRRHFRIERFDLTRAAMHEAKDNAFAAEQL